MSFQKLRNVAERQRHSWLRDIALTGALAAFVAVQAVSLFSANSSATKARAQAPAAETLTAPAQPADEDVEVEHQHEGACVAFEDALC